METMGWVTFVILVIGGVAKILRSLFDQIHPLSMKAAEVV